MRNSLSNPVKTIVYFIDGAVFGGVEQAFVHFLAHLDRKQWRPVLFHHAEPGIAPLLQEMRCLQVQTRVVPRLQGTAVIKGLPRFIASLREERPVIFHAHLNWLLSCKFGLAAAALSRTPIVIATLQQFLQPPWRENIYVQQRLVAAGVDRYIAVSDAVARQLAHAFDVPSAKIQTIHNCIPPASFNRPVNHRLKSTFNQGTNRPVVLTIARLDQQKGHQFLLQAVRQMPDAVFVLAGDGPARQELQAQVQAQAIADRILFLGHRVDVADLLAACDLFVLPSIYEGLPLAILEAMAAGRAVVATAVGGVPEAVLDGQTGLLVPPGNPDALADAVRSLLSDPARAARMGTAGKARVQQHFSIDVMARQINQTYEELLNKV